MWNVKKNYPKNYRYNMPNLQKRRSTTEHVLDCKVNLRKKNTLLEVVT